MPKWRVMNPYINLPLYSLQKITHTMIFIAIKIENYRQKTFDIFSYFCSKHRLWVHAEAVLTSTHNLCYGAKIRKTGIPLHSPVLLYKSGV